MRVVVFGDSIAYGAWDSQGEWVERLKSMAHEETIRSLGEHKNQIINLGIGGDTSKDLLARIDNEIKPRLSASWPFIFVISIGTNDQRSRRGVPEVDSIEYQKNVTQIIATAKIYTDNIIILGLAPLGVALINFKDQEYSDQRIKDYDAQLESLAITNGLPYINLRTVFEHDDIKKLHSYDNLHPNDKGHAVIASLVKPLLNELGASF